MLDDRKKIGIGLSGFGVVFTFLGLIFFFDRGLLAIGNLMFLSGVALTIGPRATLRFFMRKKNWKGSGFFLAGVLTVLYGWAVVGMCLESYGFWVLFSAFFPTVLGYLRGIPMLGSVLDAPFLKSILNKIAPAQSLPV